MKILTRLLATTAIAALSMPALAADLMVTEEPSYSPIEQPVDVGLPWNGFYGGISVGLVTVQADLTSSGETSSDTLSDFEAPDFDTIDFAEAVSSFSSLTDSEGAAAYLLGADLGYNLQVNDQFVLGLDASIGMSNLYVGAVANNATYVGYDGDGLEGTDIVGTITTAAELRWLTVLGGRAGILATPDFLLFGSGGVAFGLVNLTNESSLTFSGHDAGASTSVEYCWNGDYDCDPDNLQTNTGTFVSDGGSQAIWRAGFAIGGGFEYAIGPNWTIKTEASYWNLGTAEMDNSVTVTGYYEGDPTAGTLVTDTHGTVTLDGYFARATLAYHF